MVLCYDVALEHWYQGRGSKSLELGCPWTQKGVSTIPVWFFHCLQFHVISFSSSALIRVRQEMRHRVNNGKQRTPLCWRASLYKNKLAQVSDTIEACYHNDQAQTRKIKFFFLSLCASGMLQIMMTVVHNIFCLSVFTLNVSVILTCIFPQTELKAPQPQVSDWIHKVHWTIFLLNIDKFWRRFHIIEKHDKRAKLLV